MVLVFSSHADALENIRMRLILATSEAVERYREIKNSGAPWRTASAFCCAWWSPAPSPLPPRSAGWSRAALWEVPESSEWENFCSECCLVVSCPKPNISPVKVKQKSIVSNRSSGGDGDATGHKPLPCLHLCQSTVSKNCTTPDAEHSTPALSLLLSAFPASHCPALPWYITYRK